MSALLIQGKCSTLLIRKCQYFRVLLLWEVLFLYLSGLGFSRLNHHRPIHLPQANTLISNILMKNACLKLLYNFVKIWLLLYLMWWEPEIALEYKRAIGILYLCCGNKIQPITTQPVLNFPTSLTNIPIIFLRDLGTHKVICNQNNFLKSLTLEQLFQVGKLKRRVSFPQVEERYPVSEASFSRNCGIKSREISVSIGNADELSVSWDTLGVSGSMLHCSFFCLFLSFLSLTKQHVPNWVLTGFSV